jgi:hypothetical protein
VPNLALIPDGLFEPGKLFGAERNGEGFGSDAPGPLVTRTALSGLVAFDQAAQGNPADV